MECQWYRWFGHACIRVARCIRVKRHQDAVPLNDVATTELSDGRRADTRSTALGMDNYDTTTTTTNDNNDNNYTNDITTEHLQIVVVMVCQKAPNAPLPQTCNFCACGRKDLHTCSILRAIVSFPSELRRRSSGMFAEVARLVPPGC